jgi:hypothetical protein
VDDEVYRESRMRWARKQSRPDEGDGWLKGANLWLMTSTGKLLSGHARGPEGLAPALREVLAAYAKLPAAERRAPKVESEMKPQVPPPQGGLVLTIYDRPLARAGLEASATAVRYRLPEGDDFGGLRTSAPHGQRSSLWLTAEECRALVPDHPQKGQTCQVDGKLARRLWLHGLVPQSLWVVSGTWSPDSVREGNLHLTVEDVSAQTLRMRIYGSVVLVGLNGHFKENPALKGEKRYDARLEGVLVYDRKQENFVRWDMAALGDYSGEWFVQNWGKRWQPATPETPMPLAFAFELDQTAYELPPERRRPRSFMHAYVFRVREQFYWDADAWLEYWKKTGRTR